MRKRTRALIAVAVAVPVTVAGAGAAYAQYFQDRALPRSSVSGIDVAGMTRDEVAAVVRDRAEDVRITVTTPGGTRTQTLADLGYSVDVDATLAKLFPENRGWSTYATALVSDRSIDAAVARDAAALKSGLAALAGADARPSVEAVVRLDAGKKSFTVTPGEAGRSVDVSTLDELAASATSALTSTATTVRWVDQEPDLTTAEAKELAAAANAMIAKPVSVTSGSETFTASAQDKASWIVIPKGGATTPTVAAAKVAAWVKAQATKAKVDVRQGVRLVSASGQVLRVDVEARDGSTVANADQVAKDLTTALTGAARYKGSFTSTAKKATWNSRTIAPGAEKLAYAAAEGEKWVDVNVSNHTITAYVGSTPVQGPLAMVNGAAETPTILGTFHVNRKYAKDRMRGNNADGTTYDTPDVPWVSYFHNGFALHGAPWRSSFGYAASHGCINLPVDVAKWFYDWAPIGTPVTTHL